ncbi:unnamed protein product [Gordionus sp. m RMFG-2023]
MLFIKKFCHSNIIKCLIIFILYSNKLYIITQTIKPILVQEWAEKFGENIYDISAKATALEKITKNFMDNGATVIKLDGLDVVQTMANRIEVMLQSKVETVKRLVDTAEEAYKEHINDSNINISYYNAKEVLDANSVQNVEGKMTMIFKPHEQFDNIPINLTYSTIHVPTNVYNEDIEVLNNIAWSDKLNKVFFDNYNRDRTLIWQYFGSETGFFRMFPGIKWELDKSNIDLYDCRVKDWYIQAATSPKDLVILLDGSGSMTGLRIEIAKLTIETIMNTLSDDDFFNVLQFTGESIFVEGCFNNTLVQGNEDNKNRIKEQLENVYTKEIARFDVALIKAFELLNSTREQNRGTNCNQAIMIITDGAPETYENLFVEYNPNKRVRIFTYLIGREATDNGQLRWMSCNNKGRFSHIATLADVQENVQEYIKVISRPMVIEQEHVTIWTGIYHTKATIRLMTSVAQPVFDRKNASYGEGNLLGVMGTDVPIEELIKLTPQYKLGPNGFPFAITNNGYILFHPDLRPMYGKNIKPNYNSVDLSEVEFSEQENPHGRSYNMKLRKEMLDQKTANFTMDVKMPFDLMRRIELRTNHYFFTTLLRTPFSLGIALPDYGLHTVKGMLEIPEIDIERDFGGSLWKVVPDWVYCRLPHEENKLNDRDRIIHFLKMAQASQSSQSQEKFQDDYRAYTGNCDKELILSLAFDAKVTTSILNDWYTTNAYSNSHGIEIVLIGTRSGLTRFYEIGSKDQSQETEKFTTSSSTTSKNNLNFIDKHVKTLEDLYYKRADAIGPNKFVFSVDHNNFPDYSFALQILEEDYDETYSNANHSTLPDLDIGNLISSFASNNSLHKRTKKGSYYPGISIMASSPVVIKNKDESQSATAAVVGLRMKLDNLARVFYNTSTIDCFVEGTICYLLDDHAYVILSSANNPRHIGKFFGQVDGKIMLSLSNHVYKKVNLFDFQAMCETKVSVFSSSFKNFNMNYLQICAHIFKVLLLCFKYLLNLMQMYSSPLKPYAKVTVTLISNIIANLKHITASILYIFYINFYVSSIDLVKSASIISTYSNNSNIPFLPKNPNINDMEEDEPEYEHDIKEFRPPHQCVKRFNLFILNTQLLATEGPVSSISNCGGSAAYSSIPTKYDRLRFCGKPYTVSLVPFTNLLLVVVRKAKSGFFEAGGHDGIKPKGRKGTSTQSSLSGNAKEPYQGVQDICTLCDDLTFNFQPKSISLMHQEVLDDNFDGSYDEESDDIIKESENSDTSSSHSDGKKDIPHKKRRRNKCHGIKMHAYRRRPTTCYSHNILEKDDACGSAVSNFYYTHRLKYLTILIIWIILL